MNRRQFNAALGCVAASYVAWPDGASAQRAEPRRQARIGILNYFDARYSRVTEFTESLRELGYVEGQNLLTIHRWADGQLNRLPPLAAELVASKVDVMIALGPATWAAKQTTSSIPIVTTFSGDPVGMGLVSNLARPGGNLTGFSYMSTDLAAKRLELMVQFNPTRSNFAALYNPGEPSTKYEMEQTETGAQTLGVKLSRLAATQASELDQLFAAAAQDNVGGVIVFTHGFAEFYRRNIIEAAARYRMPTMYGWRDFVAEGGLMSYGPNVQTLVRTAASYVDRILKGERAGDLPMQQPARLELVINLKTSKALGLAVSPTWLARADEVIE
jgi:putative ABC transport system substrate-binding protein